MVIAAVAACSVACDVGRSKSGDSDGPSLMAVVAAVLAGAQVVVVTTALATMILGTAMNCATCILV